jgi:hypothetical protein
MKCARTQPLALVSAAAGVVLLAGTVLSGCDRQPFTSAALAPTPVPDAGPIGISAIIPPGTILPVPISLCMPSGSLTSGLDVTVTTRRQDVSVDRVTVKLLDGSNVGGSPITFPQADLNSRFGDTLVRAGTSRTFSLTPTFTCGFARPRSIRGDIVTIDSEGRRQSTTMDAMFP